MENFTLPDTSIDGLKSVNLRLGWLAHGRSADYHSPGFRQNHGPAIFGVTDADYAVIDSLHEGLGNGDISARESDAGRKQPSNIRLLLGLQRNIIDSPIKDAGAEVLARHDNCQQWLFTLPRANNDIRLDVQPVQQHVIDALSHARRFRIIDPFMYLDGMAAATGVNRAVADSPKAIYDTKPGIRRRDRDMVASLGLLAANMVENSSNRRPTLAFAAGRSHMDIERILQEHAIPFESEVSQTSIKPALTRRGRIRNYERAWLANAEVQKRAIQNLRS